MTKLQKCAAAAAGLAAIATVSAVPAAATPPSALTIESTIVLDRTTFHAAPGRGTAEAYTSGSFTASGAFGDAGSHVDTLMFTGFNAPDSNVIHGTSTFTGARGTITAQFQALHSPVSDPRFEGQWVISGGTGAYAGLHGEGTVTFLVENEDTIFPIVHELWTGSVH
jgi:hypothetical protein